MIRSGVGNEGSSAPPAGAETTLAELTAEVAEFTKAAGTPVSARAKPAEDREGFVHTTDASSSDHHHRRRRRRRLSKGTTQELVLRARALNDQFEKIQWKGKDVYRTPGSNAIALKEVITKLSAVIPEGTDGLKDHMETTNALIQAVVLTDKNFVEQDAPSRSRR